MRTTLVIKAWQKKQTKQNKKLQIYLPKKHVLAGKALIQLSLSAEK